MLFEIIAVMTLGLFGLAFAIKFIASLWKFIYGLAPVVVPVFILVALYMLYSPVQ